MQTVSVEFPNVVLIKGCMKLIAHKISAYILMSGEQ